MNEIVINNEVFKRYKNTIYYVSMNGEVYSDYCKRIIKKLIRGTKNKLYEYVDVYSTEKRKQIHTKVHLMVYTAWVREIEPNEQINHINDNSLDNRLENLYCGTQKENIKDCFNNQHRVGRINKLIVYDKETKQTLTFCPASDFIQYHYKGLSKQTQIKRIINRDWFKNRYELLEYSKIENLNDYKSVTTNV